MRNNLTRIQQQAIAAVVRREVCRQLLAFLQSLKTMQDVAIHLKCHQRTFQRRRVEWGFPKPAIQFGNFIRWTPEQITTWENNKANAKK